MNETVLLQNDEDALSLRQRMTILITAFLGWLGAGTVMVSGLLSGRSANLDFFGKQQIHWYSRYICAFLLGAAAGGLIFGWLGDRIGRAKAMGLSILCYALVSGLTAYAQTPTQFLILRFIACLGVGGMWPNGVALASEAWSNVSRPLLAGLIGTSANLGFMLWALLGIYRPISATDWRWTFSYIIVFAALGIFVLLFVAESPQWKEKVASKAEHSPKVPVTEVFKPPLLKYTLIGIGLGTVPLLGNWGGANWLVPWAGQVGGDEDQTLKAWTQWTRSGGAAIGALLGGWLASQFGRRKTYFAISVCSLASSIYLFWNLTPNSESFLFWTFVIGFFGTVYFGWLPLYLPEMFPTRVRATGTGVSFNFGRIAASVVVLTIGELINYFQQDYAQLGKITCWVFVLGMVIICFAPDTSDPKFIEDVEAME